MSNPTLTHSQITQLHSAYQKIGTAQNDQVFFSALANYIYLIQENEPLYTFLDSYSEQQDEPAWIQWYNLLSIAYYYYKPVLFNDLIPLDEGAREYHPLYKMKQDLDFSNPQNKGAYQELNLEKLKDALEVVQEKISALEK